MKLETLRNYLSESVVFMEDYKLLVSEDTLDVLDTDCGPLRFQRYNYLVLPHYRKKTLLDFLIWLKKAEEEQILSEEEILLIKLYLIGEIVRVVHELMSVTGYAHCDLKPDNFVISDDFRVLMIDWCSLSPSDEPTS